MIADADDRSFFETKRPLPEEREKSENLRGILEAQGTEVKGAKARSGGSACGLRNSSGADPSGPTTALKKARGLLTGWSG